MEGRRICTIILEVNFVCMCACPLAAVTVQGRGVSRAMFVSSSFIT